VGQLLTKAGDGKNWGIGPVAEETYDGESLFTQDIYKSHGRYSGVIGRHCDAIGSRKSRGKYWAEMTEY